MQLSTRVDELFYDCLPSRHRNLESSTCVCINAACVRAVVKILIEQNTRILRSK